MIRKHFVMFCCILMLVIAGFSYNAPSEDNKVSGIIFFKTQKLEELKAFYLNKVGCTLWLDQGGCQIYQAGNMLFGFCQSQEADLDGMITFFYPSKEEVDKKYRQLKKIAVSPPKTNKKYKIYHFFGRDPEGRAIEFQYFLHPVKIPGQNKQIK